MVTDLGAQSATDSVPALYFYHPDHLGSTAMVTDLDGHITQNVVYIPYGEVFVEERNGSWASPYLFNAKELDEETGLYYYGARYLNPSIALWLSTDPLQGKYPGMSPYNYCAGNPVKLVDPDGKDWVMNKETKEISWHENYTSKENTPHNYEYIGESYKELTVYCSSKGLFISLCYNSSDNNSDLRWIQTVKTNYRDVAGCKIGQDVEYLDTDSENRTNPFYFSEEQQKEFTSYGDCSYGFVDNPKRASNAFDIYWKGELTLVQQTDIGYEPIFTIDYGFKNTRDKFDLYEIKFSKTSDFQINILKEYNRIEEERKKTDSN